MLNKKYHNMFFLSKRKVNYKISNQFYLPNHTFYIKYYIVDMYVVLELNIYQEHMLYNYYLLFHCKLNMLNRSKFFLLKLMESHMICNLFEYHYSNYNIKYYKVNMLFLQDNIYYDKQYILLM